MPSRPTRSFPPPGSGSVRQEAVVDRVFAGVPARGTLFSMAKRPKRPHDSIALAKLIGDIATGQRLDTPPSHAAPRTRPVDDLATVDEDERVLLVTRRLKEARTARRKGASQGRRSTKGS